MKQVNTTTKKNTNKPIPYSNLFWSWISSFIGILCVGLLHYQVINETDMPLLIGSFGASAVLIYGVADSALAQPRNLFGGHILSAFIGVLCFKFLGQYPWFAAALAVSCAIVLMQLTHTLHPPGGATALIAVIGSDTIHNMGFLYIFVPVTSGVLVLFIVAVILNNQSKTREYPVGFKLWFQSVKKVRE